jgi:uncharacterized membrane protein
MELTYVTIMVLASMIFVLSGMVGYLYWQQSRTLQHVQSLALALAAHVEYTRQQQVVEQEPVQETEDEDDRVSVKEELEVVDGPPAATPPPVTASEASSDDVDDLQDKTSVELRELLTKKGIPYGKRDSKTVLLQLLKATS